MTERFYFIDLHYTDDTDLDDPQVVSHRLAVHGDLNAPETVDYLHELLDDNINALCNYQRECP